LCRGPSISRVFYSESRVDLGSVILRRRVLLDNLLDLALIRSLVLLKEVERVGLSGTVRVGLVEQRLYTEQDLFDINSGLPAFFFVEDGQTDGAGWVDVRVEERRDKLACNWRENC